MQQLDFTSGQSRKRAGMSKAAANNAEWLEWIRAQARAIGTYQETVSADDLRPIADAMNRHPNTPNAWGSVFKGSEWVFVDRVKSKTRSRHAGIICRYRLSQ